MGPAGSPAPAATPDASARMDSADPVDHDAEHDGAESPGAEHHGAEHDEAGAAHAVAAEDVAQPAGHEPHPSEPRADSGPVAPTDPCPASSTGSGRGGSDTDSQ
jgi:hypothetical protein